MLRLQSLGSNTSTGVPYIEDEIMAIVREGKQQGHIPGVGRVLPRQGTVIPAPPPCTHSSDVAKLKKSEKRLTKQPKYGGGSESGGCGDDEPRDDEDGGEDDKDDEDADVGTIPGDMSPGKIKQTKYCKTIPGDMSPGKGNAAKRLLEGIPKSTRQMIEEQEAVRGHLYTVQDVV
ncbi:hypothetical protein Tco_1368030 [Tanacetum coccineum]